MFSVGDNEFSYKNAIIKNTAEKTNYLPKVGYKPMNRKTINLVFCGKEKGIEE